MPLRVLSWNLFHGRSVPPAGHGLLRAFADALAGWPWDVAMLQEVPPWWPAHLARATGADQRSVLTSRNALLPVRRAIATRAPDLIRSNGGGCNALLVRGAITAHATRRLRLRPERRFAHAVRLADGTWIVNLHATAGDRPRAEADLRLARERALAWAGGAPLVLGGDANLRRPVVDGFTHVAGHHVDHLFVRGLVAVAPGETLAHGPLSDHAPLAVTLEVRRAVNGAATARV